MALVLDQQKYLFPKSNLLYVELSMKAMQGQRKTLVGHS